MLRKCPNINSGANLAIAGSIYNPQDSQLGGLWQNSLPGEAERQGQSGYIDSARARHIQELLAEIIKQMPMDDQKKPKNQINQQLQSRELTRQNQGEDPRAEITMPELSPGELVGGRYKIISVVGRGGSGMVYEVEQVFLKQKLALKTLHSVANSKVALIRFQKEAQAASKLNHPNLVRAVDFGVTQEGQPFLAMELVTGESLSEYLKWHTRLSIKETLDIFIPACSAFAYAHENGVIHRDIKPGNILLSCTPGGAAFVPKIVDFGIAKFDSGAEEQGLTKTGEVFGTPRYMSPEQCSGILVDKRSDIYSLACVLYEVLTGGAPFQGKTAVETITQHINTPPLTLKEASLGHDFPPGWQEVISKALQKSPEMRYQNFSELEEDLQLLKKNKLPKFAGATNASNKKQKAPPTAVLMAGALVVLTILGVAGWKLIAQEEKSNYVPSTIPKELPLYSSGSSSASSNFAPLPPSHLPEESGSDDLNKMSPEKFSTVDGDERIFNFGNANFGIFHVGSSYVPIAASGVKKIPANERITIIISWPDFCTHHAYMRKYQTKEVRGLNLRTSDSAQTLYQSDGYQLDDALLYANHLTDLLFLDLHNCPVSMQGLENLHLSHMNHLVELSMGKSTIEPVAFAKTYKSLLLRLSMLDIRDLHNGKVILNTLKNSKAMQSLSVGELGLTDADVETISTMPNLEHLDAEGNPGFTDKCLLSLLKLKNLHSVFLRDTRVTHNSLKTFLKMRNLKLARVPRDIWTQAERDQLKKELPDCNFKFETPKALPQEEG